MSEGIALLEELGNLKVNGRDAVLEILPLGKGDEISVWVLLEALFPVAQCLRLEHGFNCFEAMTSHLVGEDLLISIFLRESVLSNHAGRTLVLRCTVPAPKSSGSDLLPSLSSLWPNAVFYEREIWDNLGLGFYAEMSRRG